MIDLNCMGERCPLPIIHLAQLIRDTPNFAKPCTITLLSDDTATWPDLQAWSRMTGYEVYKIDELTFEILAK